MTHDNYSILKRCGFLSLVVGALTLSSTLSAGTTTYVYDMTAGQGNTPTAIAAPNASYTFTTESPNTGGPTLTASPYYSASVNANGTLFAKNQGGIEIGLGLGNDDDGEIGAGSFVVLNLTNIVNTPGLQSITFQIGSAQTGEGYNLYSLKNPVNGTESSNLTLVNQAFGTGSGDTFLSYTIPVSSISDYYAIEGVGNGTQESDDPDILISTFSATVNTPEPMTMLILGSGLAFATLGKRRKAALVH
jgi:hypothetical protein